MLMLLHHRMFAFLDDFPDQIDIQRKDIYAVYVAFPLVALWQTCQFPSQVSCKKNKVIKRLTFFLFAGTFYKRADLTFAAIKRGKNDELGCVGKLTLNGSKQIMFKQHSSSL